MAVAALAGWLAASGALDATASDKGVIAPGAALSKRGERHSATSVLHDSLLELHSTRVQGITCKHTGAIPTGLARRCDWVLMNSTNAGLIKYRSPPRCALRSANSRAPCFERTPPPPAAVCRGAGCTDAVQPQQLLPTWPARGLRRPATDPHAMPMW